VVAVAVSGCWCVGTVLVGMRMFDCVFTWTCVEMSQLRWSCGVLVLCRCMLGAALFWVVRDKMYTSGTCDYMIEKGEFL